MADGPGTADPAAPAPRAVALDGTWQLARAEPGTHEDPGALGDLEWLPAVVPGTVAAALQAAGRWSPGEPLDPDASDWWFRTRFAARPSAGPEDPVLLHLDGLATIAEVHLNGRLVASSSSMFVGVHVDVGDLLREDNVLAIRFLALAPMLRQRRRPRARWRTRLADGNLRWHRTTLLGRAPGFSSGPAPVGPWRPVRLEHVGPAAVVGAVLRPAVDDDGTGVLAVRAHLHPGAGRRIARAEVRLTGPSGTHAAPLDVGGRDADPAESPVPDPLGDLTATDPTAGDVVAVGTLRVPDVARWWPHTHGEPVLHDVHVTATLDDGTTVRSAARRAGFRTLAPGPEPAHDVLVDGLDLHVNGARVFARGAVWTGADAIGLTPTPAALRAELVAVRDAGMNLLRIPGIGVYESPRFHDLCDELGIMVWQELAFANMDYPFAEGAFRALVEAEVEELLEAVGGRPSTVVVCGSSEIEQQVAMLGLDPVLAHGPLSTEILPFAADAAGIDAVLVPSAPSGGDPPIRPDVGIANYYGVGGYRRPLDDARRAGVRFAAECLALSNVPDDEALHDLLPDAPGELVVHHPRWKAGVPRDAGAGWDFEDVRDHYLRELHGVDPAELRRVDHERYLELSRSVSGEVMAATFGEWRRAASPCGGGLVLWWRDVLPGAGWGLVDHRGAPKVVLHHLRRALAPVAVWTTDEGLGGIAVHVANDRRAPLRARLRVALHRDGEQLVADGSEELLLGPGETLERRVDAIVGRFVDSAWAYRFGPPPHDVVVASLEQDAPDGPRLLSQAEAYPAGRPHGRASAAALGLTGVVEPGPRDDEAVLVLRSRALAVGVRVAAEGWTPEDDAFTVAPGGVRRIGLRRRPDVAPQDPHVAVRATNLVGTIRVRPEVPSPGVEPEAPRP